MKKTKYARMIMDLTLDPVTKELVPRSPTWPIVAKANLDTRGEAEVQTSSKFHVVLPAYPYEVEE